MDIAVTTVTALAAFMAVVVIFITYAQIAIAESKVRVAELNKRRRPPIVPPMDW